ncbi:MAG: site-specific DNA-methyltransferase, partial [Ruminococcus sp.]|nr:site-specific DNA-methyltransferase [Ruminococcus sp.]
MPKIKASRNRTIDTPLQEGQHFLERCITLSEPAEDISSITDKTILGDTFKVCPLLPEKFADLIVADPPYNLTKRFGSRTFSKKH